MLDEVLLDSPAALAEADPAGLLAGTAAAGARVRVAARAAESAGVRALRPEGRPRSLLLAGPPGHTGTLAAVLDALGNGTVPVTALRAAGDSAEPDELRWSLPGWAGPVDLVLLATRDGTEPGLCTLAEQAYRRGCTVVAVTPEHGSLAEVLGERALVVPYPPAPGQPAPEDAAEGTKDIDPGALWALAVPLLLLAGRLGLAHLPDSAVESLAERLDHVAHACGPTTLQYENRAKTLAVELADTLPLLWSSGATADAAAGHFAARLTSLAGLPSLVAPIPEALATQGAVLSGSYARSADEDDLFRDRVAEPEPVRARLVLLHEELPDRAAALTSPLAVPRELAHRQGVALSELVPTEDIGPLQNLGELLATADFTAVYLTLAQAGAP